MRTLARPVAAPASAPAPAATAPAGATRAALAPALAAAPRDMTPLASPARVAMMRPATTGHARPRLAPAGQSLLAPSPGMLYVIAAAGLGVLMLSDFAHARSRKRAARPVRANPTGGRVARFKHACGCAARRMEKTLR